MATRTDQATVAEIISIDTGADITPHIDVANELVTEVLAGTSHSASRLKLIETWLAAHFFTVQEQLAEAERAGPVSINYQAKTGLHLESSRYGQTAMVLDTTGKLAALSKSMEKGVGRAASFTYLGRIPATTKSKLT